MKYKAGDIVKVIKVYAQWASEAREMLNGVFEIKSVRYDDYEVYTKDKSDYFYFKEEYLELAEAKTTNLIPLIAKELGVEIGEEFMLKDWSSYNYKLENYGLFSRTKGNDWLQAESDDYLYLLKNGKSILKKLRSKRRT